MKKLSLTLLAAVLSLSIYSCRETAESTETTVEEVETDLETTEESIEAEVDETGAEIEREVEQTDDNM